MASKGEIMNESSVFENDYIITVPDNLFDANGLDNDDQIDLSSKGSEEPEELSGERETDYSDVVSGINSITSSINDLYDQEYVILMETRLINDNLVILNDNLNACFNLLIVFFVIIVIKMLFSIFNKYLGLGQA